MAIFLNGEKIEQEQIKEEVERLRPHYEQMITDKPTKEKEEQLWDWSRENVIERVLLNQAARQDSASVPAAEIEKAYEKMVKESGGPEEFLKQYELKEDQIGQVKKDIENRLRFEKMIGIITQDTTDPNDEEIQTFYNENIERFTNPDMVRAAHIVKHLTPNDDEKKARKEMQKILVKLRSGGDFDELAKQQSDCSDNAGDLGYFPRGQMVQEFEDVVFKMEPGEISNVFQTEFGLHIAKVIDKTPARPIELKDVQKDITGELTEQKKQKAIEDFVDAQKSKATIEEK